MNVMFTVCVAFFSAALFAKTLQNPTSCDELLLAPAEIEADLFHRVQTSSVFADSKFFPDMTPKYTRERIRARYLRQAPRSADDLKRFVLANFDAPETIAAEPNHDRGVTSDTYVKRLWSALTRQAHGALRAGSSLIGLPLPYIVPGGRFREIYYWDSYFTQLGLLADGEEETFKNMVQIFENMLLTLGRIPNGNREYYLSRSQPPVFALMVALWQERFGTASAARFLPALKIEHAFWMKGANDLAPGSAAGHVVRLKDGTLFNRYWDELETARPEAYKEDVELAHRASIRPAGEVFRDLRAAAESGWDFSSRWFLDPNDFTTIATTRIVPIDLNGFMYFMERKISELDRAAGSDDSAEAFRRRAEARAWAITRHLWDGRTFRDLNWREDAWTSTLSIAMTTPLFVGLASRAQARSVADVVKSQFLRPGGVATTLRRTGQQWDAPNGWAPCQWLTFAGLKRYGYAELAETIAERWSAMNERVFQKTGKMMEKYDVEDPVRTAGGGEYDGQEGFGWTNGVKKAFGLSARALRHLGIQ